MGCSELEAKEFKCGTIGSVKTALSYLPISEILFDDNGNFIGKAYIENNKVIMYPMPYSNITMTVLEYSFILGKSVSNVTKHIRNKNSLPYVLKVDREVGSRKYILTVSQAIKLKQPLK